MYSVLTCVLYVRTTNEMHTSLNNLFHLIFLRHVSNKKLFIIRSSVQAAYRISSCINIHIVSATRHLVKIQGEIL